MRSKDDIREAYELAASVAEDLDNSGQHFDAAAPIILAKGFAWALEEEDADNLLEQLREDAEELLEEE
jgi:hypothetical protein